MSKAGRELSSREIDFGEIGILDTKKTFSDSEEMVTIRGDCLNLVKMSITTGKNIHVAGRVEAYSVIIGSGAILTVDGDFNVEFLTLEDSSSVLIHGNANIEHLSKTRKTKLEIEGKRKIALETILEPRDDGVEAAPAPTSTLYAAEDQEVASITGEHGGSSAPDIE